MTRGRRNQTQRTIVVAALFLTTILSGCSSAEEWIPMPGTKGAGDSGYDLRVELPTAANLVENAEVKVRDVTVGTVKRISLENWHAVVTISLENDVSLPANTRARVGQKSLLGAEYLELQEPAHGAVGDLEDGDVIPLARTGNYPETEDLLAAISTLLNGGGLSNISGIVKELNSALSGGGKAASLVLRDLAQLAKTLSEQRRNLSRLITAADVLSGELVGRSDEIGQSVEEISEGVAVLEDDKDDIVDALAAMDDLSRVGNKVIAESGDDILADVRALSRITQKLAEAGDALPRSLDTLGTVIFPVSAIGDVVKGDYLNIAATLDVSIPALERGLFPSASGKAAIDLLLGALGILPAVSAAQKHPPTEPSTSANSSPTSKGLDDLLGSPKAGAPIPATPPVLDSLLGLLGVHR